MARYTGQKCVSVSTGSPATFDATGFAALTWTQVGELDKTSRLELKFTEIAFTPLCTGVESVSKGGRQKQMHDLGVGVDNDDAGQMILKAALASQTQVVSIKVIENSGDILYYRARVMEGPISGDEDGNGTYKGTYKLSLVPQVNGVSTVEVNAP